MNMKWFTASILGCLILGFSTMAIASGFAIIEQSVSGLGNAFSGGAASAEDATTVFFNPAGMTRLDGQQISAGVHVIIPSAKFTTTSAPTNAAGAPIRDAAGNPIASGTATDDAGQTGVVPNLYYTNKLSEKWSVGLGVNAPFGLATEYDKTWAGRYHAVESAVAAININPNIAYQATERLSLAAGVSAQYIDVTLSSMVDGGLINANLAALGSPAANLAMAADPTNLSNPANDIFGENTADDWGYGYNLGLLYQFNEDTRAGLSYRSQIKHKVTGEITTSVPATVANLAAAGLFAEQSINGSITLPSSASVSIFHQVNDRLALMGDVSWTEWSTFEQLVINFEGPGIAGSPNSTTTENWEDTWRYSLGASYKASEALTLRTGVAYDESPIIDEFRTPRIPDEDRTWVSLGCSYQFTDALSADISYAHLFVPDSTLSKTTTTPEDAGRGNLQGEYENQVDIASIQMNYRF
jgi:long-chain fatty acid transport protein